jgi:hypothetical protein
VEQGGRHDDGFDLGGHSLPDMRIIGLLRTDLGWEGVLARCNGHHAHE